MMKYSKVFMEAIGYELAPHVVDTLSLEKRLAPVYEKLRLPLGQLEALTGIRERRWWAPETALSKSAAEAGRKALETAGVRGEDVGCLIYAGVCRENSEPATACAVADALGVGGKAAVFDISNACLGVLNGILDVANRIELGQIRAGLVVSCESAREINESMIKHLLANPDYDNLRLSMATLTGGSGAVGVLLTDGSFAGARHKLVGGVCIAENRHHGLCTWNRDHMMTDAAAVLKHGLEVTEKTWAAFSSAMKWTSESLDRVICHQVGGPHRAAMLGAIGATEEKDFCTYEYLGNIGTVSLPLTAAIAEEREFLNKGDRVAFLGIGSGLNCMMLGWEW